MCVWEHALAAEGLAKKSKCTHCGSELLPVTETTWSRKMTLWCWHCSRFTDSYISAGDYETIPLHLENIPRVPPSACETLRGAVTETDFASLLGQLPNNRVRGQDSLPFELLLHALKRMQTHMFSPDVI